MLMSIGSEPPRGNTDLVILPLARAAAQKEAAAETSDTYSIAVTEAPRAPTAPGPHCVLQRPQGQAHIANPEVAGAGGNEHGAKGGGWAIFRVRIPLNN
jgi:hypothetical protein